MVFWRIPTAMCCCIPLRCIACAAGLGDIGRTFGFRPALKGAASGQFVEAVRELIVGWIQTRTWIDDGCGSRVGQYSRENLRALLPCCDQREWSYQGDTTEDWRRQARGNCRVASVCCSRSNTRGTGARNGSSPRSALPPQRTDTSGAIPPGRSRTPVRAQRAATFYQVYSTGPAPGARPFRESRGHTQVCYTGGKKAMSLTCMLA